MKRPSIDQWMGIVLAFMAALVLVLAITEIRRDWEHVVPVGTEDAMPAIVAPRLDGEVEELATGQTGGDVLLVDFWATWCPPCIKEMPILDAIEDRYEGQGLRLLAVNADDARTRQDQARLVSAFLDKHDIELSSVVLDDGQLQRAFKIQALPTLFLVGRDGRIREVYTGLTSERRLRRDVEKALAAAVDGGAGGAG